MNPNLSGVQTLGESELVFAEVILRASVVDSVLKQLSQATPENIHQYLPHPETVKQARNLLEKLGFRISFAGPTHITIAAPKKIFEDIFRTRLELRFLEKNTFQETHQSYVEPVGSLTIPAELQNVIEAIEFPQPVTYFAAAPPALAYDHMVVSVDVARAMDAIRVHQLGITGAGIKVAFVDSGFSTPHHAYYVAQGYTIQPTVSDPTDPVPGTDPVGHGTGIAACALAVAPGCTLMPFKMPGGPASRPASDSIGRAVADGAHIIVCSWGLTAFSTTVRIAINAAIASGIVVCVAAGDNGTVGWPSTEPNVIAVGGAFLADNDALSAASLASSGTNPINPGRQVPDVCGICGNLPRGVLITMPSGAGSIYDAGLAGVPYPMQDTTTATDGWFVSSGTSGANAMVAGVAALILEANPGFTPAQVKTRLMDSCIDVYAGASSNGEAAGPGVDNATGRGLVQAYLAIRDTDVWLRDNDTSDIGLVPTHSRRPSYPWHAHWTSPDIRVFEAPLLNPANDFEGTPTTEPVYGQDNYVYMRVRNRGRQGATGVTAGLYYADPSTSLAFPADWNDGQSGVAAQGSISVAAVATNAQTGISILSNQVLVLPEPYVFRPPDPNIATQRQDLPDGRVAGHFCLLARLFSVSDPIRPGGSGQSSIIQDNNLGMKNVHVFSAPPGHFIRFTFTVRAPRRELQGIHALDFRLYNLPQGSSVHVATLQGGLGGDWIGAHQQNGHVELQQGDKPPQLVGIQFNPEHDAILQLSCELPEGSVGKDYPIDVVQRIGDRTVGGVRLVARSIRPQEDHVLTSA